MRTKSLDETLLARARLVESRDPDAGAHIDRVGAYSLTLAAALRNHPDFGHEVNAEFVSLIAVAAPLHDIGKAAIPDRVLLKPGRLDAAEWAIMKTHAAIGAETIDALAREFDAEDLFAMARDIALTHHERWGGSGYPRGLRGDEIPLSGRITAIADVYDALRSRRAYKEPYSHHVAHSIIRESAGTHFDPRLADVFDEVEREFDEISRRLAGDAAAFTVASAA